MKLESTPSVTINNKWFSHGMTILIFSVAGAIALIIYHIGDRGKIEPEHNKNQQEEAILNMLGDNDPRVKK
jgi:hypothetical protein